MKKLFLFVLFFSFSFLYSQTFSNGNFEQWTSNNPDGWILTPDGTDVSFSQGTNEGRGGTGHALKITANSNGSSYDGQFEAMVDGITEGQNYTLSIWTKSPSGLNNVWVRFWDTRFFDNSDTQVGVDLDEGSYSSGDNSDWLEYTTTTVTAPAGAVKLRVNFRIYIQSGFTTGDYVLVDDLSLNGNILPVELTSFRASNLNNGVMLNWATATEIDNYGYDVERKTSNVSWTKIGFVNGNGNSVSTKNYSYLDKSITSGSYQYRLKQIDFSGKYEYSKTVEVSYSNTPASFQLSQNYPNPFNPSTKINFSTAKSGNVSLVIYNVLGQQVKTLVNRFMEAGQHIINFNAEGLQSGLYFYKLESSGLKEVKKMTLLK